MDTSKDFWDELRDDSFPDDDEIKMGVSEARWNTLENGKETEKFSISGFQPRQK